MAVDIIARALAGGVAGRIDNIIESGLVIEDDGEGNITFKEKETDEPIYVPYAEGVEF